MVAFIGISGLLHALFSLAVHGTRHIMGCIGVNPVC